MNLITSIKGIGPTSAKILKENGFASVKDIAGATVEQLQAVPGFGAVRAALTIKDAARLLGAEVAAPVPPSKKKKKGQKTGKNKKKDNKQSPKKKKKEKKEKKKMDKAKPTKKQKKTKKGSGKKKKK